MVNRQIFLGGRPYPPEEGTAVNSKKSLEERVRSQGIHIGQKVPEDGGNVKEKWGTEGCRAEGVEQSLGTGQLLIISD